MSVESLIYRAVVSGSCSVHPPAGFPRLPDGYTLPSDLRQFFRKCGGVHLFPDRDYGISLANLAGFSESNPVILGQQFHDDISCSWFVVAMTSDSEHLSIDLSPDRFGRCYDSFHEVHGIAGSSKIIAASFSDLFARLLDSQGEYWYWLQPDFMDMGDAYDST